MGASPEVGTPLLALRAHALRRIFISVPTVIFLDCEWESVKAASNVEDHDGITFEEAAMALDDPNEIATPDPTYPDRVNSLVMSPPAHGSAGALHARRLGLPVTRGPLGQRAPLDAQAVRGVGRHSRQAGNWRTRARPVFQTLSLFDSPTGCVDICGPRYAAPPGRRDRPRAARAPRRSARAPSPRPTASAWSGPGPKMFVPDLESS
jgi:hypothetical protein